MNVRIFDIETLRGMFLYMDYDPVKDEWKHFKVTKTVNELDGMMKWLTDDKPDYLVGYNSLNFDSQVVEWIMRNSEKWYDRSAAEIVEMIFNKSQDCIRDGNINSIPAYMETSLSVKQIDLMKVHHFDNEHRRTSLKWLEFMMNMENVEEMPYHHTTIDFTEKQEQEIIDYCKNDILTTYKFYQYTRGQVNHEFYKGKDKIQDRIDLINELDKKYPNHGFSINYSDSKIGDELNKLTYMELTKIKDVNRLHELKRNRGRTDGFKFSEAIPKCISFKTPTFQQFYRKVKGEQVRLLGKGKEFKLEYNGTIYTIAQGGIHSCEKGRVVRASEEYIIRDADVGSQYPNAIRKRGLYPKHLGEAWNKVGQKNIEKRMEYKARIKEDVKYKGLSDMYKLALNSGYFGKTNDSNNWQYGPEVCFRCTIGNQFEILMLIEMLEVEGIHCISANTDGIVCQIPVYKNDRYYEICHEWERIVGNEDLGKLEYTDFKLLIQESVNHYWAVGTDGKVKVKGRFNIDVELNKNNTDKVSRVERKALREYFVNNIPIEDTINAETDIFMFCFGAKISKNYYFQVIDNEGGETVYDKKLMRYYISKTGGKLIKRKREEAETKGVKMTRIADGYKVRECNNIKSAELDDVNREYYIDRAKKVAGGIEGWTPVSTNQLSLW